MKILVLVIYVTWSFSQPYPEPRYEIVCDKEKASWIVHCIESSKSYPEPNQHVYRLYEIDFENEKMVQISIPKIKFEGEL